MGSPCALLSAVTVLSVLCRTRAVSHASTFGTTCRELGDLGSCSPPGTVEVCSSLARGWRSRQPRDHRLMVPVLFLFLSGRWFYPLCLSRGKSKNSRAAASIPEPTGKSVSEFCKNGGTPLDCQCWRRWRSGRKPARSSPFCGASTSTVCRGVTPKNLSLLNPVRGLVGGWMVVVSCKFETSGTAP